MATTRDPRAHGGYAERLTDADLTWLASLREDGAVHAAATRLRADPRLLAETLEDPSTHEALFSDGADSADPLLRASPFLVFAVAVHRVHADLRTETYVDEWVGARQRLPVFATPELRGLLDDDLLRLFLAELLASYTRVASHSVWVSTRRGMRRQRFSELDLRRLSSLLEVLPSAAHPKVYRRLGDLALLLTGVFPDHTAGRRFGQIDLRLLGHGLGDGGDAEHLSEALETRGAVGLLEVLGSRWYEQALAGASGRPKGADAALPTVSDRFEDVRRVLNVLTDRYLFPFRSQWFPAPS